MCIALFSRNYLDFLRNPQKFEDLSWKSKKAFGHSNELLGIPKTNQRNYRNFCDDPENF